jgi:hypothetical protein
VKFKLSEKSIAQLGAKPIGWYRVKLTTSAAIRAGVESRAGVVPKLRFVAFVYGSNDTPFATVYTEDGKPVALTMSVSARSLPGGCPTGGVILREAIDKPSFC